MNDNEMIFDDEEIREMYKANVRAAAPDMGRLWSRIEAAVDASEQETQVSARQQIKPSGRKKGMMRAAAAAAAFVLVAGAGAVWFRMHSSVDGSQAPANGSAASSYVMTDTNGQPEQSELTGETNKENITQNSTDHLGTYKDKETEEDNDNLDYATNSFGTDPFVQGSSESIVLVRVYSEVGADTADGWFMDDKGDVYSFEGVAVKGGIYTRLEGLAKEREPVSSEGEETAQKIRRLTDWLNATDKQQAGSETDDDAYRCYAVGSRSVLVNGQDEEAAAALMDIAEDIDKELRR